VRKHVGADTNSCGQSQFWQILVTALSRGLCHDGAAGIVRRLIGHHGPVPPVHWLGEPRRIIERAMRLIGVAANWPILCSFGL